MPDFAGYPVALVYDRPGGSPVQQLIWGDYVKRGSERDGDWVEVTKARNEVGWMREADLQSERILEVNFVDVGQGDGCFIRTPSDRGIIVDAGKEDNLFWFLRWRFNIRNRRGAPPIHVEHAVITHPDADHYLGFEPVFESPHFTVGTVHHNGIVQRTSRPILGPKRKANGIDYLTQLAPTEDALLSLINDPEVVGDAWYPRVLRAAADSGTVDDFRMLSSADGFLPGYEDDKPLTIRVLGPVPETPEGLPTGDGERYLRRLGNDGETKNGHSVVLRLEIGGVRILLTGDLNRHAQEYLLRHYTGLDPDDPAVEDGIVALARQHFGADVAKSCHHGSADFSEPFLRSVDPIATVISSGDDEPYAHPRADALGAVGRWGRGDRPLVFSTELARSTREFVRRPEVIRERAGADLDAAREAMVSGEEHSDDGTRSSVVAEYERAVAVYGMINLRHRRGPRPHRPETRTSSQSRRRVGLLLPRTS